MITDLLADSNTPPNVASTLKIISTMIAPTTAFHTAQRPFVAQMSPLIERFRDEHQEEKVRDQPDLKDDIHLPMMGVCSHLLQYINYINFYISIQALSLIMIYSGPVSCLMVLYDLFVLLC